MLRPIKCLDAMYDSKGADPSDIFGVKQECLPWQVIIFSYAIHVKVHVIS
jgi:hypothetical protein